MKTLFTLFTVPVFVFMSLNPAFAQETKSVTLEVEGMTCRMCTPAVKKALSQVKGVREVRVNYDGKEALVKYREGEARVPDMIKAVRDLGFTASLRENLSPKRKGGEKK